MPASDIDTLAINTIRCVSADQPTAGNSGHPGAPMGLAPVAYTLFQKYLKFNPKNPDWISRDRFILSNGHACALQYTLLHLYGYGLTIDDLKHFRHTGSKTPGHPESLDTKGVEITTGPLGQGISSAVGFAIAEAQAAATFNKPGFELFNNFTYVIAGDGCLQEGISSEASSLAGHLALGKLIVFYDDNHITIDGNTDVSFTEDVLARYEAYGWHTQTVKDGDYDIAAIGAAIEKAKQVPNKPSIIKVTTTIGFGSLKEGSESVHGSPLKADDLAHVKKLFGFDPEKSFQVPQSVYDLTHKKAAQGAAAEEEWNQLLEKYAKEYPDLAADLKRRISKKLPAGWEKALPTYKAGDKALATRKLSEITLEKLAPTLPELIGGSADLTPSNLTRWSNAVDFEPPHTGLGSYAGRYVRYGIREHAMGAALNGLAAYGLHIPYGGTFLNFVSYAAGSVRIGAISGLRSIWVATHDSIGLGEDGPTHQPIETIAHFRALPNLQDWRPADGNEVSAAYYKSITDENTPSVIALTRQNLPVLEHSSIEKALKGGYVAVDDAQFNFIIVATGSEVSLAIETIPVLKKHGINTRVVSLPSWFAFDQQSKEYQLSVLPDNVPILSVEVLSTLGWQKYSHEQFGLDRFGASGPYKELYAKFGFTPEGIAERAVKTFNFWKDVKPLRSPVNHAFARNPVVYH